MRSGGTRKAALHWSRKSNSRETGPLENDFHGCSALIRNYFQAEFFLIFPPTHCFHFSYGVRIKKFSKPGKFKPNKEGEFSRCPFNTCPLSLGVLPPPRTCHLSTKSNNRRAWMSVKTLWGKPWIIFFRHYEMLLNLGRVFAQVAFCSP